MTVTIFARLARDVATVYPEVSTIDGDGNTVVAAGSISQTIRGRLQYEVPGEDTSGGDVTATTARFFADRWPTGYAGRVTVCGHDWDVIGEPSVHGGSSRVDHVVVRLRARAPSKAA